MTPQIVKRSWRDLKPPRRDARKSHNPERFARIEGDILKRGNRNPLYARPDGEVITGETRRQIAVKHQIDEVPCIVIDREMTETEALTEQLQENECRSDFKSSERAEIYQRLMDSNGWSQAELAAHLGHTNRSFVCNWPSRNHVLRRLGGLRSRSSSLFFWGRLKRDMRWILATSIQAALLLGLCS